jgi:AcrR family transcriptional regulator
VTRRGDRTRERLIEATLAVVREVGYARASTRAIAEAAGVAEGTIYRHFPDKTSLLFAAALGPDAAVVESLAELPGRAGTGTVEGNLTEALTRLAELHGRVFALELAIQADPELSAQRQRMLTSGEPLPGPPDAIAAYLAAEQGLGRVRRDVIPTEVAVLLLATLFGLAMTGPPGGGVDPARIRSAVQVLTQGILPT